MYQLKIGSIPLPKLYIVEDKAEVKKCRSLGIPFLIKPSGWSDEKLIKAVLWRTLVNKFPHIDWTNTLKINPYDLNQLEVVEVASCHETNPGLEGGSSDDNLYTTMDDGYRVRDGGLDHEVDLAEKRSSIDNYIGDLGYYVSIEELQSLKLLPVFLDDITNAIKTNLSNTVYMDGYNKKLECNLGSWYGSEQAPNLIILDTSGSIPRGVAGTMVTLIDTLRNQANADLIITSWCSKYYKANEDLPSPDELAGMIGGMNECSQFYRILRQHILGKHWGNVIVFGDSDAPDDSRFHRYAKQRIKDRELQTTKIDRIMAFDTYRERVPGYGLWATAASPKAPIEYNWRWTSCMK